MERPARSRTDATHTQSKVYDLSTPAGGIRMNFGDKRELNERVGTYA